MKSIGEHIDELNELMSRKGFDGYFLSNSDFPGKLKDSLHQHMQNVMHESTPVRPFYLTTYSLWNGEEKPYVICDFKLQYDTKAGFSVMKLDAKCVVDRLSNPARTMEVNLGKNEDMPTCAAVNAALSPKRKSSLKL